MGSLLSVQGSRRTAPRQEGTQGSNGPAYPFRIPHGRHIACLSFVPFRHESPCLTEKTSYRTLYVLSPTEPPPPFRAPATACPRETYTRSATCLHHRNSSARPYGIRKAAPNIAHFSSQNADNAVSPQTGFGIPQAYRDSGICGAPLPSRPRSGPVFYPTSLFFSCFLPTASDSQNDFPNDIFCANDNLTIIRSGTS